MLAKQLDVTPRPHRVNALLPFTTMMSCVVKSARTTLKKALFDPARNPNIKKKMLSIRFRRNLSKKVSLSRDYIFYQKKGKNMRKAIAKSQKMLVAEFLRRTENSNEAWGRGTFSVTDTTQNIYRKFCLEFSDIKMSFTAFCRGRPSNVRLIQYTQRHVCLCQRHANMSMKATASKVLPKCLSELTLMSDEDVREKLNDMDNTRPIKHQQWRKKEVQYKTTLMKKVKLQEVVEDVDTFSQTLMRELPEFRAQCGRVFTQYEEIRYLRGKLNPD